jgi:hypothetical protein
MAHGDLTFHAGITSNIKKDGGKKNERSIKIVLIA